MSDTFSRLKGEPANLSKSGGPSELSKSTTIREGVNSIVSGIENNQAIDFKQLLQDHRNRTEVSLPYTIMQVEDVMFINDRKLVALEYIFYQKKGKYSRIVSDNHDNTHDHFFGTNEYMKDLNPLSTFKNEPVNFHDSKIDYLKEHKQKKNNKHRQSIMVNSSPENQEEAGNALLAKMKGQMLPKSKVKFMETQSGTDAMVEGILTLWRISKNGQLSQIKEVNIDFNNMKFQNSRDGKMMLQLSNDHKLITLAQEDNEKNEVRVQAWHSDNLKSYDLPKQLQDNLSKYQKGELKEISLVSSNQYVLMIRKMNKINHADQKYLKYYIFERQSGRKIIEFSNYSETASSIQNQSLKCLGLLVKEPNQEEEKEDDDYYDEEEEDEDGDYASVEEDAEEDAQDSAYEGGDMAGEDKPLEIGFFFATDSGESMFKDQYHMFCMTIDLDALKDYFNDNDGLMYYINMLAKTYYSTHGESKCFPVPKSWFLNPKNEEEPWQGQILLTTNSKFKQFGLLNKKKHQYLAFEQSKIYNDETHEYDEKYEQIDSQYVPESSIAQVGRNQQTKKFLILTLRVHGFGSTAYCFFARGSQRRTIKFSADHLYANQDTIVQPIDSRIDDPDFEIHNQYMLQSCSISKGDQEIFLKTQVLTKEKGASMVVTNENRTSITQVHQGSFPIIAYNLGQKKLAIQNTIGQCKQLIYELPANEQFVNFIQFNSFQDVGFYSGKLNIQCASGLLFLVKNTRNKQFQVNFLFIDPYKPDVQIALFKSSKTINVPQKKAYQDTILKSIAYCTRKNKKDIDYEIKLLIQYPHALFIAEMLDIEDGEESDINTDDSKHDNESSVADESEEDAEAVDKSPFTLTKNPILLDSSNHMHYVVSHDGICQVKEINPVNDNHHLVVMEIKAERCYGLSQHGDSLYFLDEFKNIIKLDRQKVSRLRQESGHLHIKDRDLPNFKPSVRDSIIITDKYLIQESKIFFLYQDKPLMNGILDMEQMSEFPDNQDGNKGDDDKLYANGPFMINGCEDFFLVYKYGESMSYNLRLQTLPDSTSTTLLSDFQKKVDLTTFLDDGQILLKIENRFLLFDENGHFVDEVEFKDNQPVAEQITNTTLQQKSEVQDHVHDSHHGESNEIPEADRMILITMSKSNRYFIFFDQRKKIFKVYEIAMQPQKEKKINAKKTLRKEQVNYAFEPVFEIDFFESYLVKTILELSNETQDHITALIDKIKTGAIKFIISVFSEKPEVYLSHSRHESDDTTIDIYGSIFYQEGGIKNFMQRLKFDSNAKEDINNIINKEEIKVKNLLKKEQDIQLRLPKNFQDSVLIDKYDYKIDQLEVRRYNVVQSHIFHDFVIVQCGRFIKYGQINEQWFNDDIESANDFKDAGIIFENTVEITNVFSTCVQKVYQIVAKDTEKNILVIVTWDFENDIEVSMLQVPCDGGNRPENYITRGMNQKMNYFINKHQIFDLEFNIPMQQVTDNALDSKQVPKRFFQQRKIFRDSSRYLKIDRPNILEFPITRMDLEFWEDISDYGEDPEQINLNTELYQFNQIFNGNSLFHYFATNLDVMEMLHKKFKFSKTEGFLTEAEENMTLAILNPDNNGHSALQIALSNQRPKCFELMIDMLEGYSGFCITKMMLHSIQDMINHGSEIIVKFFDTCTFQPLLMQQPLIVPWPQDLDELVFATGSSLINPDFLIQRMTAKISGFDKILKEFQELVEEDNQEEKEEKKVYGHQGQRNSLRSWKLGQAESDSLLKQRVMIEAIDFDWIFREDNTENFIQILRNNQNSKIFVQKSVRCFVEYMWSYYQKEIFRKIFLPYCVYMLCNVILAANFTLVHLDHIESEHLDESYQYSKACIIVLSTISGMLWLKFFSQELTQVKELYKQGHSLVSHFADFWNLVDFCSLVYTLMFLIVLNACAISDSLIFNKPHVREIASICCFLLWVKVFYWMRLFKDTAPFLHLILQTIKDVQVFGIMLAIIIMAFANFFFILNANTPANPHNKEQLEEEGDFSYLEAHTGNGFFDAIIGVFLISLGEFNFDGYAKGPDRMVCWFFFLMAIYLLLLVFMNMLIAIMGETFAQVQEIKDELALKEQIAMISDHIWLFDLKKKFANRRYILRICRDISLDSGAPEISEEIQDVGQSINKKNDEMLSILLQRLDGLDKTNRQLVKAQSAQSEKFNKISKIVEDQHLKELQKAREERQKQEGEEDAAVE